ncbi:MAG: hypothetical protein VX822_06175 [Candidatus Neomarinimicrobiota bacterium]|nr:hypothetical protein [Candidatus Neomarinimicrobiota bacterium]
MIDSATFSIGGRKFQVDPERGFLPNPDPILELLPQYSKWDRLGAETPALLHNRNFRQAVKELPEIDSSALRDGPELDRAMLLLSMFANAYVWDGYEPSTTIPSPLAVPLCQVAYRCGRPPIASHASIVLNNWRRIDPDGPIELENLATMQNFLGGTDEDWFFLTTAAIEFAGAAAVRASVEGLIAASVGDNGEVGRALGRINEAVKDCLSILDRIPEKCTPEVFYSQIRPFLAGWPEEGVIYEGISDEPKTFIGGSAAQSSLLQSIDAALGICHTHIDSGPFLIEMRKYMPPKHRLFLENLEEQTCLREYVKKTGSIELKEKLNESIGIVEKFRKNHMKITAQYILEQADNEEDISGTGGTEFVTFLSRTRADTCGSKIP